MATRCAAVLVGVQAGPGERVQPLVALALPGWHLLVYWRLLWAHPGLGVHSAPGLGQAAAWAQVFSQRWDAQRAAAWVARAPAVPEMVQGVWAVLAAVPVQPPP